MFLPVSVLTSTSSKGETSVASETASTGSAVVSSTAASVVVSVASSVTSSVVVSSSETVVSYAAAVVVLADFVLPLLGAAKAVVLIKKQAAIASAANLVNFFMFCLLNSIKDCP